MAKKIANLYCDIILVLHYVLYITLHIMQSMYWLSLERKSTAPLFAGPNKNQKFWYRSSYTTCILCKEGKLYLRESF